MKPKQLLILVLIGLLLGGAGLWVRSRHQRALVDSSTKIGEKLLPGFDPGQVAGLRISASSNVLEVVRRQDAWVVPQRGDYPANVAQVVKLVQKFWRMEIAQPVNPSRAGALDLAPPPAGAGVLLEFQNASNRPLKSVILGKQPTRGAPSEDMPLGAGAGEDARYVQVGSDRRSIALVADSLREVDAKPEDWLNKDWIKVEKLKAISVLATNATNNWKLVRETESGEWKLAGAKSDETADSGKVSSMNYLLSSPSFNDVALDFKFNETNKPTTTATLDTFEDFTYKLNLAPKSGDDYYVQTAVAAEIPKERTPGKDEKAEDKDKLDKEFKEKNQKLQDKLKAQKAYDQWVYVVSKWTVDALLKERKDLLAEKKEEPKPEATKPAEMNAPPLAPAPAPTPPPAKPVKKAPPSRGTNKVAAPNPPSMPPEPPAPKSEAK